MEKGVIIGRKNSDVILSKASNFGKMLEDVRKLAVSKSLWNDDMQRDLPKKWEKHGDMIVFPQKSFLHINWKFIGRELWAVVAKSLNAGRIGRKRQIDELRTPHVDLLFGSDGWVDYIDERGVKFSYDTTIRVFESSKKTEMKRISKLACQGQIILDMYAGLGYYSLTFLACCDAKQVISIDWNEEILESLVRSAQVNNVEDRICVIHGDCRRVCPTLVADRVYLGLLPSCRAHWLVACKALKPEGGIIHINEIINKTEEKKALKTEKAAEKTKKTILRQKTAPSLKSVSEEVGSSRPLDSQPKNVENEETGEKSETPVKRKFSRSASIVEEMENRVLPEVQIWKEYETNGWKKLEENLKEFAMDCAQSCTRFLNNIHLSDVMYIVTIVNIVKYGEVSKGKEHIVLELLCCQKNASVEHLISKFAAENLKS